MNTLTNWKSSGRKLNVLVCIKCILYIRKHENNANNTANKTPRCKNWKFGNIFNWSCFNLLVILLVVLIEFVVVVVFVAVGWTAEDADNDKLANLSGLFPLLVFVLGGDSVKWFKYYLIDHYFSILIYLQLSIMDHQ